MLKQNAYGGTSYDLAIQKAGSLIETHFDPTKVNIIIFLSDGECGAPMKQLRAICEQNKAKGSPLYLYTVLFGSDNNSGSLKKMANIAQSYHLTNTSSDVLQCQFTHTINEIKLIDHFNEIAESLRKHKPSLLKKV
ncbi:hypothetical protein RirG_221040 [Rhizophagus irregularis DAOM 197198w]|uniref:VWFA domain-containing protein n=2 Tax=Rhizophagus irregularis TaxID=588596 RepID=A0A015K8X8_RHIIW|nr:hypothetical protein RirG_221040 [Rhizophagus irregularis DAOM 197198w]